jgi:hypothetical protein
LEATAIAFHPAANVLYAVSFDYDANQRAYSQTLYSVDGHDGSWYALAVPRNEPAVEMRGIAFVPTS